MRHTALVTLLKFSLLVLLALAWCEGLSRLLTGGELASHPQLVSALVILVLVSSVLVVFTSQRWVQWLFRPHRVNVRDADANLVCVAHILQRQAASLNIPPPILYVYESACLNAFIVGGIWRQQHLYLSQTLLRQLKTDEIEAVIAHEMAHVYYRDVVVNEAFYGMGMICQYLLQHTFGKFLAMLTKTTNKKETAKSIAIALVYGGLLLPLWLMMLLYSRRSEYRADALASQLVGHQQYLWLLYQLKGMCRDNVFNLDRQPVLRDYFTSHPPIHHRINALESSQHA